jgi:hypothetical protein
MEQATAGVSIPSQMLVAQALCHVRKRKGAVNAYAAARRAMLANGEMFKHYLGDHCTWYTGLPLSGKGMFAYFLPFEGFDRALDKAKVKLVDGIACGERYGGRYRMNMAHANSYTEAALKRLRESL